MQKGLKNSISLANETARDSLAYKSFLKKHKINLPISTQEDFLKLPITDKKTYIQKNRLAHLTASGNLPSVIYASSGSSGKPTFWAKGLSQEKIGAQIHEEIFSKIFHFKKAEPTLVIICFSMGVWVAGGFTLASCKELSRQGYNISCITPGIEKTDIFFAFEHLAKEFKNVVLAGYPPFVMDIILECRKKNIDLPKNLKILTAGDKFSEGFRTKLAEFAEIKNYAGIISLYGSADVGPMGFETPLSIFLRREAEKNSALRQMLFENSPELPAFLQFDPEKIYFESVNGELILTADAGIPLVRYNIHDQGKIFDFEKIKTILKDLKLTENAKQHGLNEWQLPFVVKTGRTDVAVNFYALNILPEQINASLKEKQISKYLNGNYFAYHKMVKNHAQEELGLILETKTKTRPQKSLVKKAQASIVKTLSSLSLEFRKLHQTIGKRALPKIKFIEPGNLAKYSKLQHMGLLNIQGKKPKIVL
jgi:phenylacetate-CoA ligase